jgi:DNA polymerase-3 subunit delta'
LAADRTDAGVLPAFMDYTALGRGYALLWEQAHTGRMVHAYLLAGTRGVGKKTFARVLAAALLCDRRPAPCGECGACRRVFTGNEPDVIEVLSQGNKVISIDRIRDTLALISQNSYGGGPRIVIIEPVERLTPSAQNCLLKSLEDPPANVVFLLLSNEQSALLSTIASRCELVRLSPWPDEQLQKALVALGYPGERVRTVLPRAGGIVEAALAALTDEPAQDRLVALAERALAVRQDADVVKLSTELKDDRENADLFLNALEQSLHRALMLRTGLLPTQAVPEPNANEWGLNCPAEDLTALIEAVFSARERRQSQVNWQAGIDRLLMKILEAKTKWRQS